MAYRQKQVYFSPEKNALLKAERGIGFEDVLLAIEMGHVLDDLAHPNSEKYPNQSVFIILIAIINYVYIVPYVEEENSIFLKTIIPSRKINKRYNKAANDD
ncbi:toxin [Methylomonas sp. LW13]|uniref:hypothetical protein n=1 Tax=unclassified Methylomonas TaxID=2608980 RepID=UPI00051C8162|nr:hypothetical protein [Methylomonas sp. LW13]QBC26413.1 toxin [Methylomonas sp. LW13]